MTIEETAASRAHVHGVVRRLSSFQAALLRDMDRGKWYSVYPADGYELFPDWFYRQQTQPQVTLRAMVDRGCDNSQESKKEVRGRSLFTAGFEYDERW